MVERAPEKREVTGSTPVPTTMGSTRSRRVALGFVVLALALAGCGQVSKGRTRRTVAINLSEQGKPQFEPLQTTVQKGDKVTIVVINRTDKVHGFAIRGYGVPPMEVAPDAPNDVVFTAKKEGTYEIYCQLHPTHLKAALLVE